MSTEQLAGGLANAGHVERDGDVVYRPAPPNVATLHRVLDHLAAVGFEAPGPIAVHDGRETVGYIAGDVAVPPFPAWSMSDAMLGEVGLFLRRYHDAVAGFQIPPDAQWSGQLADPLAWSTEFRPIVCHNDVCPENVVFRDGRPVGLLDFDFAAPGRPVWDVAQAAGYWCPLTDPVLAAELRRPEFDPRARLALFADAYGLSVDDRASFVAVYFETEEVSVRFVLDQIAAGHRQFAELWNAGGRQRFDRKMHWLEANRDALHEAVTG